MTEKQPIQIVWFKRDLRIHDHKPLFEAAKSNIPTLPLYITEPEYWTQPFAARRHWHFIHDCLTELRDDLTKLGQPLIVQTGEVTDILQTLADQYDITHIHAHEESGNDWTYKRDLAVLAWCAQNKVPITEYPYNGVVRRLKNRDDWSKIRNARMAQDVVPKPQKITPLPDFEIGEIPAKDDLMFGDPVPGIVQKGGRREGINTLKSFLNERAKNYIYTLSAPGPSELYCSRLSTHLTWGTLSVCEVLKASAKRKQILSEDEKGFKRNLSAFSSRLAWRCHFIQKIEDQPEIEYECMHPAFEGMREPDHNEDYFQAWKDGQTGYPFIDACMRNLTHEGWITFRMRAMLVSFASYNLWLDWRKTGYHLAKLFTDYEPGIHYSQLQMQSGVTGINAVRIYSPIKQSYEHDPDGEFIKQWVPELKTIPTEWIHEPWAMKKTLLNQSDCVIGEDYPMPIVDHKEAIRHARAKLSEVRKQEGFRDESRKVFDKLGSRKKKSSRKPKKKPKENGQMELPI